MDLIAHILAQRDPYASYGAFDLSPRHVAAIVAVRKRMDSEVTAESVVDVLDYVFEPVRGLALSGMPQDFVDDLFVWREQGFESIIYCRTIHELAGLRITGRKQAKIIRSYGDSHRRKTRGLEGFVFPSIFDPEGTWA